MQISVVGISHKSAPVAVREHFAFAPHELPPLLERLGEIYAGAAVLSTCNRTEIYVVASRPVTDPRPFVALIAELKDDAIDGAPFFALSGKDAARHLFRVAAGVESMVIGESEILGQVRAAFTAATAAGTHSPALSRLFHTAIRVGRRVRTQTSIGRYTVSVSSTAVALARGGPGQLDGKTVLVVGAGEAGKLTAGTLTGAGVAEVIVTSRTPERTTDLAAALGGRAVAFEQRAEAIADADIVISSTAANDFVIDRPMIERAMSRRPQRPLLLVDIAVPRDIDPAVIDVPGVRLYDIDEIQAVAEANMHLRRKELTAAEKIIEEQTEKFSEWLRALEVVPTVASLRARAETLRLAELERTLAKTTMSAADRKRVEAMTAALVKRLLHDPIARLKTPGEGERYLEAARALFDLDTPPPPPEADDAD
jgi:glutamyl-tRNA reductase